MMLGSRTSTPTRAHRPAMSTDPHPDAARTAPDPGPDRLG